MVRYAVGLNKGQIVKHLSSIDLKATEQAKGIGVKAIQFVKEHKKGAIIVGSGVALAGAGVHAYNKAKIMNQRL